MGGLGGIDGVLLRDRGATDCLFQPGGPPQLRSMPPSPNGCRLPVEKRDEGSRAEHDKIPFALPTLVVAKRIQ